VIRIKAIGVQNSPYLGNCNASHHGYSAYPRVWTSLHCIQNTALFKSLFLAFCIPSWEGTTLSQNFINVWKHEAIRNSAMWLSLPIFHPHSRNRIQVPRRHILHLKMFKGIAFRTSLQHNTLTPAETYRLSVTRLQQCHLAAVR
jgi:hypothetical protein